MYTLKENMKRFNTKNLNEQEDLALGRFAKKPAGRDVTQGDVDTARDKAVKFGSQPWGMSVITKSGEAEINNFEDAVLALKNGANKEELLADLDENMPGIMALCKMA